jgi:hypothetical protein
MQHTTFDHPQPRQTSLGECEHHPCVIVQSVTPSTLGARAGVHITNTEGYPTKDGEGIFILWNEEWVTVHSEDPSNSEAISRTQTAAALRRPPDSIIGFYPEGMSGSNYFPIDEDCCISTRNGKSYIFRRNGGVQGPYPSSVLPATPLPLIQPPTNPSDTSRDPLQHRFSVKNVGPSNHVGHCFTRATTVDPRCLNRDAIIGETASGHNTQDRFISGESTNSQFDDDRFKHPHSVFANFVKHQTAYSEQSRGPEWKGVDDDYSGI